MQEREAGADAIIASARPHAAHHDLAPALHPQELRACGSEGAGMEPMPIVRALGPELCQGGSRSVVGLLGAFPEATMRELMSTSATWASGCSQPGLLTGDSADAPEFAPCRAHLHCPTLSRRMEAGLPPLSDWLAPRDKAVSWSSALSPDPHLNLPQLALRSAQADVGTGAAPHHDSLLHPQRAAAASPADCHPSRSRGPSAAVRPLRSSARAPRPAVLILRAAVGRRGDPPVPAGLSARQAHEHR